MAEERTVQLFPPEPGFAEMAWHSRTKFVGRIRSGQGQALRARFEAASWGRQTIPCRFQHPVTRRWFAFDAYVEDMIVGEDLQFTLIPAGEIRHAPLPRTSKTKPIEVVGQV